MILNWDLKEAMEKLVKSFRSFAFKEKDIYLFQI